MELPKPEKRSSSHESKDLSTGEYDRRAAELTELLKACRDLSDILNPDELFATFAGIIKNKFGIPKLALLVYDPDQETFELVFSYGLGRLNFKFKRGTNKLWETILQDKPFAVVDQSGKPLFPKFLGKQDFSVLPSGLWAPLVMRGEVIGLLTMGSKAGDQPFDEFDLYFLQQITAQAAVSINTCRLYAQREREKEGLDKTLQNLSLLYGIGKAMNDISDLKNLLQYILSQAVEITSAERARSCYTASKPIGSISVCWRDWRILNSRRGSTTTKSGAAASNPVKGSPARFLGMPNP